MVATALGAIGALRQEVIFPHRGYMILFSLKEKFRFDSSLLAKYIEVRKRLVGCRGAFSLVTSANSECLLQAG